MLGGGEGRGVGMLGGVLEQEGLGGAGSWEAGMVKEGGDGVQGVVEERVMGGAGVPGVAEEGMPGCRWVEGGVQVLLRCRGWVCVGVQGRRRRCRGAEAEEGVPVGAGVCVWGEVGPGVQKQRRAC